MPSIWPTAHITLQELRYDVNTACLASDTLTPRNNHLNPPTLTLKLRPHPPLRALQLLLIEGSWHIPHNRHQRRNRC